MRWFWSQAMVSASRWLVGSSRRSMSGASRRSLQSATRRRSPPGGGGTSAGGGGRREEEHVRGLGEELAERDAAALSAGEGGHVGVVGGAAERLHGDVDLG